MAARGEFTSKAPPELLAAMRAIAEREGRDFDAVVEDAMWEYLRGKVGPGVRPEVGPLLRQRGEEPALDGAAGA